MCIVTGFGGISEDPLDFRVCVGHKNGPEWRGGTHCLFAGENVYFIYIYVFFACDELNSRNIGWRRRGGS